MAITLNVADYCEECEAFEPEVTQIKYNNGCDSNIQCEHYKKCNRMYQHAKKFVEKEYANMNSVGVL